MAPPACPRTATQHAGNRGRGTVERGVRKWPAGRLACVSPGRAGGFPERTAGRAGGARGGHSRMSLRPRAPAAAPAALWSREADSPRSSSEARAVGEVDQAPGTGEPTGCAQGSAEGPAVPPHPACSEPSSGPWAQGRHMPHVVNITPSSLTA